jgi:hypothetical protein
MQFQVQFSKTQEKTTSSLHIYIGPPLRKFLSKYNVVEAREIARFLHKLVTPLATYVSMIIYGQEDVKVTERSQRLASEATP